jgi:hypothetical protein
MRQFVSKFLGLVRGIAPAFALAAVVVVGSLLTFSETTLKGMLDGWLSQCIVVVDTLHERNEAPTVRLYTFGAMPDSLPLTFSVESGLIERVSLLNHVEQGTTLSSLNVLVHPLANQRCPGDLCPETVTASEKLTVRIKPVSPNYVFQFRVLLGDPAAYRQLKVYIKPLLNETLSCRVEVSGFSNMLVRQSLLRQVLILATLVAAFAYILNYLRLRIGRPS